MKLIFCIFSVYNPPEHIQQPYAPSPPTTYTAWSTLQPQPPIVSPAPAAINCWSLTSSPPPPHQLAASSAQTTPEQSPTHHFPQYHQPISNIGNLTQLSYSNYYNQDQVTPYSTHYQAEYVPLVNGSEIGYAHIDPTGAAVSVERDDGSVVYQEVGQIEHVEHIERATSVRNEPESPASNSSSTNAQNGNEWSHQQL